MTNNNVARIFFLIAAALYVTVSHVPSALAGPPFKGTTGPDYYINCTISSVAGSFTAALSTYTVKGNCQVDVPDSNPKGGSTFPTVTDSYDWTAVGTYQPGRYNTSETISVRLSSGQFGIISQISSTMICKQDPWLQPDGLSCGSVRYQQTGTLGSSLGDDDVKAYLTQTNPVVPRSSILSPQQRAALNQQYQRQLVSNLPQDNSALLPAKPPSGVSTNPSNSTKAIAALQASAPVIRSPVANSNNVEGRFQVKATVVGSYTGTEGVYVQFTFLGNATAPNQNSFVNIFNISLKDLVNGITVPNYITRGGQGRWLVRAQITTPNAGPWSAAVPFILTSLSSTNIPSNLNKK